MGFKKCSKCQKEFICAVESRGCWCESVKLDEKAFQVLKQEYANCLCKNCLAAFENKRV